MFSPEVAIRAACKELNDKPKANPQDKLNISAVARSHSINYTTLRNRFQGHTKPRKAAHGRQQLVSPGSLTSKNKGDLQEIAGALSLSEDGTAKDLQARIVAHFDANSHLRNSPLFTGLFNRIRVSSTTNPTNETLPQHSRPDNPLFSTNLVNIVSQSQAGPGSSIYHENRVNSYFNSVPYQPLYYPTFPPGPSTQSNRPISESTAIA